ncbi:MAG: choice-of-anchor tandem repeat GloVer-containing protein [Terriglobales bacterium]
MLHTFEDSNTDGANPQAALIADKSGNLYSTTEYGGVNQVGTVFSLGAGGAYKVVYQFLNYPDGARPVAPLVADGSGIFYGTTYTGGVECVRESATYCGTVFRVDAAGNETVLYAFHGNPDGANPDAGLIRDANGNLYGTTLFGGTTGGGVVFEIDGSGTEHVLYTFKGGSDGFAPYGPIVIDASGNIYGTTTSGGGSSACNTPSSSGCGTVFKLKHTAKGWKESVIHRFRNTDGWSPNGLYLDEKTNELYGMTELGGGKTGNCMYSQTSTKCGVVFELSDNGGGFAVRYRFSGQTDGGAPFDTVTMDGSGNLYGTTSTGGDLSCNGVGCGTVFKLSKAGKLSVLHTFSGGSDGATPVGSLLLLKNELYGTASIGGDNSCQTQEGGGPGCGTVFALTP